jgi:outer membrane receptor protein involved in Fe transport
VNADQWTASIVDVAPYAIAEVKAGPVTIVPGLRADGFLLEGSRATPRAGATPAIGYSRLTAGVDPRLSVSWAVTPRVTLSAAGGYYHQPPAPADLSAVFGTPALDLQRAIHVSAGQAARLGAGLDLEVTGFYKWLDHLVVRSRRPDPTLAQALTQDGEGRSYGAQVLLRRKLGQGFSGWLAYTLSRSERHYVGDPGYRLFDFDQTHVLSVAASYEHRGWVAGVRFRAATGDPRTPVERGFVDTTSGQYQPVFGAQNSIRLPAFYQLDLRAEKTITWPRVSLRISLDVLNVTFHKNAEEIVYSFDYSRSAYVTGLPILAVLGARVSI